MRRDKTKETILLIVLALLALPVFQSAWPILPEPSLSGAIIVSPKPGFSYHALREGAFQEEITNHLNDAMGYRSFFIRVNNELQYSLFRMIKAQSVVEGKEGFLFEIGYIDSYMGKDFIGANAIQNKLEKLRFIQDTLASKGITLLIVFAPNKARVYPDKVPEQSQRPAPQTNYSEYVLEAMNLGVNHFDVEKWFEEIRDTIQYPLITKLGIHWSQYGMVLVMDSLVRQLEYLRSEDLPDLRLEAVQPMVSRHVLDCDLAQGMNLLFPVNQPRSGKPIFTVIQKNKIKPRVLAIADSFFSAIYEDSLAASFFSSPHFWYYFRELYQRGEPTLKTEQVNLSDELFQQDVVMIMSNEFSLLNFGWGFIEKIYAMLNGLSYDDTLDREKILEFERLIRENPEWLEQVKIKAQQREIPLDSMIVLDAIYMVERAVILKNRDQ